jgi:hypothetical protein
LAWANTGGRTGQTLIDGGELFPDQVEPIGLGQVPA